MSLRPGWKGWQSRKGTSQVPFLPTIHTNQHVKEKALHNRQSPKWADLHSPNESCHLPNLYWCLKEERCSSQSSMCTSKSAPLSAQTWWSFPQRAVEAHGQERT
ncbi:hypothetical protein AMTRI_Chr11g155230 [Amborella trichopoda]